VLTDGAVHLILDFKMALVDADLSLQTADIILDLWSQVVIQVVQIMYLLMDMQSGLDLNQLSIRTTSSGVNLITQLDKLFLTNLETQ
jgi:septum formation inhibitor-activating ATPase MinD